MVEGVPEMTRFHVVNKTDDAPHSMATHKDIQVAFAVERQPVRMLGFYSDKHHGVFTHHGSNTHVHVETLDRRMSGHLDEVRFDAPTTLYLPRE